MIWYDMIMIWHKYQYGDPTLAHVASDATRVYSVRDIIICNVMLSVVGTFTRQSTASGPVRLQCHRTENEQHQPRLRTDTCLELDTDLRTYTVIHSLNFLSHESAILHTCSSFLSSTIRIRYNYAIRVAFNYMKQLRMNVLRVRIAVVFCYCRVLGIFV